ncbi:MAG: hypothetical protein AAF550_07870 [Myxococcota bacterium]
MTGTSGSNGNADLTEEHDDDSREDNIEETSQGEESGKTAKKPSSSGAAQVAAEILAGEHPATGIAEQNALMMGESRSASTKAARVLAEIATLRTDLVVPLIPDFAKGITSANKRVVQTAADALPQLARIQPARVARQLPLLKGSYAETSETGKDGIVRTFAALCTASVAYQKKLEPVLTTALEEADGKTLLRWTKIVLPALKGEPHANARAVVERRMYQIPRATAQKIAEFLGVKLRHSYRGV